jgi:hypothetical protein
MIPVEIFTLSQRLRGSLETKQHRVVDALNATTESAVLLRDVEMTQLTGPLAYVEPLSTVKLSKRALSFAIPQDEESDDPARRQQRFFAYTPKDARPILICLENYEIRGNIHVPRTGTATQYRDQLELPGGDFFPVTAATIVFLLKPSLVFQAGVVIVNKAQLTVTGLVPPRE